MTLNARAEKAHKELFARYDQLNALWEQAEERLTKHHIPCPVCCPYGTYDLDWRHPGSFTIAECLGLQKIKGKWRICYGSYADTQEPDPDSWTPITECSAEIRVQAAKGLPDLEKAVVESAERFIPKVDEAIKALTTALDQPNNLAELLTERARLNGRHE